MGYSCSSKASFAMSAIEQVLGIGSDLKLSGNAWLHKGNQYFWERGRENRDGAITGSVMKIFVKDGIYGASPAGTFRIEPDGTVSRFPTSTKAQRAACKKFAEVQYTRQFEPIKWRNQRRPLWEAACKHDGFDPESKFVVFSKDNPHAAALNQLENPLNEFI